MSPFLNPWAAWAGLGLVSIPIIIHIINRRRLRRLDWAAMEFLLLAMKKNRRRIRLEHLILLLLRIVLMALIALFLARPRLSDRNLGWLASPFMSEEKIFIVDDSLSMSQSLSRGKTFDSAIADLNGALKSLSEQGSRDRVTLLKTSDPGQPLVRGGFIDRDRAAELERSVKALSPTSMRMNLPVTLERISDYFASAADETTQRPRAISILTDLRASDWTDGAGGASAALTTAFERLLEDPDNQPRIIVLDVGSDENANVAITGVSLESGRPTVDVQTEIKVEVRNFGPQPVRDLSLRMTFRSLQDEDSPPKMVPAGKIDLIRPQDTFGAGVHCTFREPGQYGVAVEITNADDAISGDNRFDFVLDVVRSTEILLVDGEPSEERWESETDFLTTAFNPADDEQFGFEILTVIEDSLPQSDLSEFGAVFLANVYHLEDDFLAALGRYVRAGGALVIFLGDQVDPQVAARELGSEAKEGHPARGLLPAKIGELQSNDDTPLALQPALDHEFLRGLPEGAETAFQQLQFARHLALEPVPDARIVARFSEPDGSPAIVEQAVGAGRVILAASSADREWNDWAPNPTYPMFLQDTLATLGRARGREPEHAAGTTIQIPVDISVHDKEASYRGPDPEAPERTLIASSVADDTSAGEFQFLIEDTTKAGLGRLKLRRRGGSEDRKGVAIRSEPLESDLRRIEPDKLKQLYPDVPLTVLQDTTDFSEVGRGQFEIADLLIGLLLLLLFVEGALACRFAHHQRAAKHKGPPTLEARVTPPLDAGGRS